VATGIAHVFVQHTSCSLVLTENADPSVRRDLETLACALGTRRRSGVSARCEGDDDMAAHGRNILAGSSVTVPVGNGELRLGTWQGIYLWEHRTMGPSTAGRRDHRRLTRTRAAAALDSC
jgi:secondary thiamine-phosphate synthase enzyme